MTAASGRLHGLVIPPAEFEALYAPPFETITHTMIEETNYPVSVKQ